MSELQKELRSVMATLPQRFLEQMIEKKLRDQGATFPKVLPKKIAMWLLSGSDHPFKFKGGPDVTLKLDTSDVEGVLEAIKEFNKNKLPSVIDHAADLTAKKVLKRLKSTWDEERRLQDAELEDFRKGMERRWGEPIGQLRMLITIVREWASETNNYVGRLRDGEKKRLLQLLVRFVVRSCQTADEISCLLENGFADGAMARWRTLHEINVVTAVIVEHGWPLAERYLAHQAVESRRAKDKYAKCCGQLGFRPLSSKAIKKIDGAFDAGIVKYGVEFGKDYGWAAHHLKKSRVTFADLEEAAGQAAMRSFYQMGNDNIHAGVKSMFVRLGLLDNYDMLLAGRSNAGLTDPGQNAAHTLTQTAVLALMRNNLDDIVRGKVAEKLRDEIPGSFGKADRQLRKDHKRYLAI
jgi:hypothetical protein